MRTEQAPCPGVVICGVPRSGKSILAREVALTTAASHVYCDGLVTAFERALPDVGIKHDLPTLELAYERFGPWAYEYLKELAAKSVPFIAESYHLSPGLAASLAADVGAHVVVLGYPRADPDRKVEEIRRYSRHDDWMAPYTDPEAREYVVAFIRRSAAHEAEARERGVRFVDTSFDFADVIADETRRLSALFGPRPPT